jgi:hypothetical protein
MKCLTLGLCVMALVACTDKPPPEQPKPPQPVSSTPFDTLRATEPRAKNVQKIVDDAAARQRKAIDQPQQ